MEQFKQASSIDEVIDLLKGPLSSVTIDNDAVFEWMREICSKAETTTDLNVRMALLRFTVASILPCLSQQPRWTQSDEWKTLGSTCAETYRLMEEKVLVTQRKTMEELRHVIEMQLECLDFQTSFLERTRNESKESRLDSPHGTVISICLDMIARMFQHCQASETFYGENFSQMADILASSFRKSFALLKHCFTFLNGVEECHDVQVAASIAKQLTDIGIISTSFDAVCVQTCWKASVCFIVKFRDSVDREASVGSLTSALVLWFTKCVSVAPLETPNPNQSHQETKQFAKSVKALRFMFSLVLKLSHELPDAVHKSVRQLFDLALEVETCGLPSLCPPTLAVTAREELETNIVPVIEPLTGLLTSHVAIVGILASQSDLRENRHFGYLRFLLRVISLFPGLPRGMQDALMDRRSSVQEDSDSCVLLDALFFAVTECYMELGLPVKIKASLIRTKPLQDVGLYEFVCSHLCSFVAQLSAKYFPSLERCLFRRLLSEYPHCVTLAIDTWCFLARWGSAELCRDHVVALGRLLVALPVHLHLTSYWHVCLLFRRLVPLLAVQHQLLVLEQFDPSVDINALKVWKEIPLERLSREVVDKMLHHLPLICSQELSRENLSIAYCSFWFVSRVVSLPCQQLSLVRTHLVAFIEPVVSLLQTSIAKEYIDPVIPALDFLAAVLSLVNPYVCLEIIDCCQHIASFASPPTDCLVAVCHFLTSLGKVTFPPSHSRASLHAVSQLFQKLLVSNDWLVVHHSLVAFQSFAEHTPHSEAISSCVPKHLKTTVANFVQGLVAANAQSDHNIEATVTRLRKGLEEFRTHADADDDTKEIHVEQSVNFEINASPIPCTHTSQDLLVSIEPVEKKRKVDHSSHTLYREVVDSIVVGIGRLEELLDKDKDGEHLPPLWLPSELVAMRDELRKLVKQANSCS